MESERLRRNRCHHWRRPSGRRLPGALPLIVRSAGDLIALIIAVPVSVGAALVINRDGCRNAVVGCGNSPGIQLRPVPSVIVGL